MLHYAYTKSREPQKCSPATDTCSLAMDGRPIIRTTNDNHSRFDQKASSPYTGAGKWNAAKPANFAVIGYITGALQAVTGC